MFVTICSLTLALVLTYQKLGRDHFMVEQQLPPAISFSANVLQKPAVEQSDQATTVKFNLPPPSNFTLTLESEFILAKLGEKSFVKVEIPISIDYQNNHLSFSASQPNYKTITPGLASKPYATFYSRDESNSDQQITKTLDFFFFEHDGHVFGPARYKIEIVVTQTD